MNRIISPLLFLQMILCGIAGLRGLLPGCGSCGGELRPGDLLAGLTGAGAYFVIWWLRNVSDRLCAARTIMGLAAGVHAALLLHLQRTGGSCLWCLLAAGGGFILFLLHLHEKEGSALVPCVAACAALLLVRQAMPLPPSVEPREGPVRMTVYESKACGFCRDLHERILPPLKRRFGDRLRIDRRSAEHHEEIRWTPTLVIHDVPRPEVIEGIPSYRYLEERIALRLPDRKEKE